MNPREIFLKALSDFEPVLNRYGYYKNDYEEPRWQVSSQDNWSVLFINLKLHLKMYVDFVVWEDGKVNLSLTMCRIPREKTFFALSWFLEGHKLNEKINCNLEPGGNVDDFCRTFFKSLEVLFDNELNNQITGKSFENHWQALMDSMNEY
jgi:hypothetical protein